MRAIYKGLGIFFLISSVTTTAFSQEDEPEAAAAAAPATEEAPPKYPIRWLNRPWTMAQGILETNLVFDAGQFSTAADSIHPLYLTATYGITDLVETKFIHIVSSHTVATELGISLFTIPHFAMRLGLQVPFNFTGQVVQDASVNLLTFIGIIDDTIGFILFNSGYKLLNFRFPQGSFGFDSTLPVSVVWNATENLFLQFDVVLATLHSDKAQEYIGQTTPLSLFALYAINKYVDFFGSAYTTNANDFTNTWGFSGGFNLKLDLTS